MELNDKVYDEIVNLSEEGNGLFDDKKYLDAKNKYIAALELIPNPKTDWEASTWLYTALGDVSFFLQSYDEAKNFFLDALNCPDGIGNPFIMLRLGESLYETGGDIDKIRDYLVRAFMLGGIEVFEGEDEKYFKTISDIVL